MKKCFLFYVTLIYVLPLLPMDTLPDKASFSLIFSSIQVLYNERRIDLADISSLRCVSTAAYRYYSIPRVSSFSQFHLKSDPSAYSMRSNILRYYAKPKKKEADCAKHKRKGLFSQLWDIDHSIRNVDVSLLCNEKVEKKFVLKDYSAKKAMNKYKKNSCDESQLQKKRFELFILIIGRKAERYQQIVPTVTENFRAARFNICDIKDEYTKKEGKWWPYLQATIFALVRRDYPELLLAVMGDKIDPRSFSSVARIDKISIISFLLKHCFNDFFIIDSDGMTLLHHMCEHWNDVFVNAFITEAVVQKCTINLQLTDRFGRSPYNLLLGDRRYDNFRKTNILAYLSDYSGMYLDITQSEESR